MIKMVNKMINTFGKRKRAIARATIKPGTGIVKVNNIELAHYTPELRKLRIQEPLILAGEKVKNLDIKIMMTIVLCHAWEEYPFLMCHQGSLRKNLCLSVKRAI